MFFVLIDERKNNIIVSTHCYQQVEIDRHRDWGLARTNMNLVSSERTMLMLSTQKDGRTMDAFKDSTLFNPDLCGWT
jgi:hypothetical protein